MIFRRKSKGGQSNLAGGERRLGQGWVSRGPISHRPDDLAVYKAVLGDGFKEVGDSPDYSVRYGRVNG